jgi:hypothetical protein
MSDLTRPERLQIMLSREEVKALDDWRFNKRMPSRAAAVRELLKRGLQAEGFELAEAGKKSQDFTMIPPGDGAMNGISASQTAKSIGKLRRGPRPNR